MLNRSSLTPKTTRPTDASKSLVFIDANVPDYAVLAAGVQEGMEVFILHPAEDGIEQITQALRGRSQIKAVHIISHGSGGCLYAGSSILNLNTIERYKHQLRSWGRAIAEKAEILLYGCQVATGGNESLIQRLQELTGANVAASRTLTGNPARGGNWELEVRTGVIFSSIALTPEVRQAYTGVLAAGDLDPTFGNGGKVTIQNTFLPTGLAIQSDGKIVIASSSSLGSAGDWILTRLNSDGSLDTSFGVGGKVTTNIGNFDYYPTLTLQSDGKILATGGSDGDVAIVRYNSDGTLDTSFDGDGKVITDFGFSEGRDITVQADGKIVVAVGDIDPGSSFPKPTEGEALIRDFTLARYNSDGSLDTSFGTEGIVTTDLPEYSGIGSHGLIIQPDGKILATGSAGSGFELPRDSDFALVRYNSDGSLDTSFGNSGTVITDVDSGFARSIALQVDGKIAIAGGIRSPNNPPGLDYAIVRYNNDGSLDTSFGTNGFVTTDFGVTQSGR